MAQQRHDAAIAAMGAREWAMLGALALVWGGSFFFNGVAVRELPSLTLVWLRVAIAAAGRWRSCARSGSASRPTR